MLFFFISYAVLDIVLLLFENQRATRVCDYYLERARIEGRLSTTDENKLKTEIEKYGMKVDYITALSTVESQGDARILKIPNNPDASTITMQVAIVPAIEPFMASAIIGEEQDNSAFRIKVGGTVLSERTTP